MLYVLFKKLEIDIDVIDEKIDKIGTDIEYKEPPSKKHADKLGKRFRWSLITCLVGIIIIPSYILILTCITGGKEMSKKDTAGNTATHKVVDDRNSTHKVVDDRNSTLEKSSYGSSLPAIFNTDKDDKKEDSQTQAPPKEETQTPEQPKQDQDQEKK